MIAQTSPDAVLHTAEIVTPLPWAQVERLQQVVLKFAHDMTNSLVVSVSHTDLALMTATDPAQIALLTQLRPHIAAPFEVLAAGRAVFAGAARDGARTLVALRECIQQHAMMEQVAITWRMDLDAVPPEMNAADWTHIVEVLVQNALDAHACAARDLAPGQFAGAREISVSAQPNQGIWLRVADNGPGCSDLHAAANGQLARAGKGHLGLGLTVAASLCAQANLELVLQPNESSGLIASVRARS